MLWSDGHGLIELVNNLLRGSAAFAGWMAKAAGAHSIRNIKNEIVAGPGRYAERDRIEIDLMARFPGDDMIGAGGITAYAQRTHNFSLAIIKGQTSAKNNNASNGLADHVIILLTELLCIRGKRRVSSM